jgi:hypothetical protein
MAKLFDAAGNEVEAFTPEELEAKKKEALDEYLKDHPDQSEAVKTAQQDLEVAKNKIKELEENGGGDGNKGQKDRLLKERNDAENKLKELTDTFTKEISSLKETFFGGIKGKILDKLSGGDKNLRDKIEKEYSEFKGDATTEAQIQERLTKAYTIAKGTAPTPGFMDGLGGAGDKGNGEHKGTGAQESENAKAQRKVLGISDDVAKKYEGQIEQPKA